MEGNACYKFSTIRNFVQSTGASPIRTALDIGANIGAVSCEMASYFPETRIYAFEPVPEYYLRAVEATRHLPQVVVLNTAVTAQHKYTDLIGCRRRRSKDQLKLLKGLPAAGPGWIGGSVVVPSDAAFNEEHFALLPARVAPVTLDEVVEIVCKLEGVETIDLVKFDCEGCEMSSIGCAKPGTMARLRYIVGEYHGIESFYRVMEGKLFQTHNVNLIGDRSLGAFFAEPVAYAPGILDPDRSNMLLDRPWLSSTPLSWNVFRRDYVLPGEEWCHAL